MPGERRLLPGAGPRATPSSGAPLNAQPPGRSFPRGLEGSRVIGPRKRSLNFLTAPRVGGEVDDELMKHGFTQTATDVAGDQVWGYYRNASTGECVVVHFDAQRVVKSVAQGLPACKP